MQQCLCFDNIYCNIEQLDNFVAFILRENAYLNMLNALIQKVEFSARDPKVDLKIRLPN